MKKFKTEEEFKQHKELLQEMLDSGTLSPGSFIELTNEAIRTYYAHVFSRKESGDD